MVLKKRTAAAILCLLGIGIFGSTKRGDRSGFEIYRSFCFTSGGYCNTSLSVIIYEEDYDMDAVFEEVKVFHNSMNGEPDELEIRLYNSGDDYRSGNCTGKRTYYKVR